MDFAKDDFYVNAVSCLPRDKIKSCHEEHKYLLSKKAIVIVWSLLSPDPAQLGQVQAEKYFHVT